MLGGSLGKSLGWKDSTGGEHGHTLHYFWQENQDRGAWRATVQRVTELGELTEAPWHIKKGNQ